MDQKPLTSGDFSRFVSVTRWFKWSGIILLVCGLIWTGHTALFVLEARRTTARVVAVRIERAVKAGHADSIIPTLEYHDATGRLQRHEPFQGISECRVGDDVAVLYDPRAPGRVCINSFWTLWTGSAGVTFVGLGAAVLGIIVGYAIRNTPQE
jgi:hypothetical protein